MNIQQAMVGLLLLVWACAVIWLGIDGAQRRYQRHLARTRRPDAPVLGVERERQLHAIVKGTSRRRAGYQQGHEYGGPR